MILIADCRLSSRCACLSSAAYSTLVLEILLTEPIDGPSGVTVCIPVMFEIMVLLYEKAGPAVGFVS